MTPGKLPRDISGQEFRKAVARIGFAFTRQKGSHMVLFRPETSTTLVVPDHKVMRVGLLRKLIDQAGLDVDEFIGLMD